MARIDYSRFDRIYDGDDDDGDGWNRRHPVANLPAGVQRQLAAIEAARRSGDMGTAHAAAAELERAVETAPADFRAALAAVRVSRDSPEDEAASALEAAQREANAATADPTQLEAFLRRHGVSEAELAALQAGSSADLTKLSQRMVASTLASASKAGGLKTGTAQGGPGAETVSEAEARRRLAVQRERLEEVERLVAQQQRAAEEAQQEAESARRELEEAEAKKAAQASKVEAALVGARADIAAEAAKRHEAEDSQLRIAMEVKRRGNLAMAQADLNACLRLYDQALAEIESIGQVGSNDLLPTAQATLEAARAERLLVLSNRAACLLKMRRDEACETDCTAALGDTEAQTRLPPRLQLKVLLRRAEARRRMGHCDAAAQDGLQAAKLVRVNGKVSLGLSEEEASAIDQMTKQLLRTAASLGEGKAKGSEAATSTKGTPPDTS